MLFFAKSEQDSTYFASERRVKFLGNQPTSQQLLLTYVEHGHKIRHMSHMGW